MASYTAPGVYVQDVASASQTVTQASSSIGILIGVARAGVANTAKKIGSWTEYIENFACGLDTPFDENSYLPYAVYGFFQNGGKELYVGNVKKNAKSATGSGTVLNCEAASEGVWGNDLSIVIARASDYTEESKTFDITVSLGSSDKIVVSDVTSANVIDTMNNHRSLKSWLYSVEFADGVTELAEETISFSGGSDGDELKDSDFIDALTMLDFLDDVTMVAIPGQTSKAVNDALMSYCDNNELFPFLDMPRGATAEETRAYRKSISAFTGVMCYPWIKVNDPLTDGLKAVPTCGHAMGVYARSIEAYGVYKAPGGVEAVVRGAIEMDTVITKAVLSSLNPVGVVCIMSRPNAGIVLWGVRSLNSTDSDMKYVSDGLLNLMLKKSLYDGTQYAVFERNTDKLWKKVSTTCKSFLETLREQGAFKGEADEAYFVTVDESNNTDQTINEGQLIIDIGYAPTKPAEFVVFRLAHSIVSDNG